MKKSMKKVLMALSASCVLAATSALSGCSYLIYKIWDDNRTNDILEQLQKEKDEANKPQEEEPAFVRQSYLVSNTTGSTISYQMLSLVDAKTYSLVVLEKDGGMDGFTKTSLLMQGEYTREGNLVTIVPGLGTYAGTSDGASYTYMNGQLEENRSKLYETVFGSNKSIALMKDGSFKVGGTSDSTDEVTGKGKTYRLVDTTSRPTYQTLTLFDDMYFLTSHALHSTTPDLAVSAFVTVGSYTVDETSVDANIEGQEGEHTYDLVTLTPGRGFMYANNNGSDMNFDLRSDASFSQWYALSLGTASKTLTVSETGYTYLVGVREVKIPAWGFYFPVSSEPEQTDDPDTPDTPDEPEEVVNIISLVGDVNQAFLLDFYSDGTYHFEFKTYSAAEDGTWEFVDGVLTLTCGERVNTFAKNEDGSYTMNYISNKSEQMSQQFTINAEDYKTAFAKALVSLKGNKNEAFILDIYADGTYYFEFTTYSAGEEGTWEVVDGKLTLTCGETVNVFEKDGNGNFTVNYISNRSAQMSQEYTISASDYLVFNNVLVSILGNKNEAFILDIKADGTYYFEFTTYSAGEEGTWEILDGKLTLTCGETVNVFEQDEEGNYTINYISNRSAQMSQEFTISASDYKANFVTKLLNLKGDKNDAFILEIYDDGTYYFEFTTYSAGESGTWSMDGKVLTLVCNDTVNVFEANENGGYTINYISNRSAQMSQEFSITKEEYGKFDNVLLSLLGNKNQAFILDLNADGTYHFEFTTYSAGEDGTWTIVKGKLVLTCNGTVNVFELDESGNYTINYISNRSAQMTQEYTISAKEYRDLFLTTTIQLVGNKNQAFILKLYEEGVYYFEFTTYSAGEAGTWAFVDGKLTLTCGEKVNVFEKDEEGNYTINYISNRSAQMSQEYTISAEDYKDKFATTFLSLKGEKNEAFILEFREDGTYYFEFTTYSASEEGVYSFENGVLTLTCGEKVNVFEKNEEGDYVINYISNRSAQMSQEYKISAQTYRQFFQKEEVALVGNKNEAFILNFYSDGTYYFEFTTYSAGESGTYAMNDGVLTLTCGEKVNTFALQEDGTYLIDYISNRSAQMTQEYTLSAYQFSKLS